MGTSTPSTVSSKLQRIAKLAKESPEMKIRTLAHHIDVEFLKAAFRQVRKDGAVGIDGTTAADYAANLEENLKSLVDRFKSGAYKAPPVRRVHIPKAGKPGQTRPIGVPAFEDKVLQRAVSMVLNAVYEQDFLPCSYGFRPGRSAHEALRAIDKGLTKMRGGHVLEIDIQSFFDALEHSHLRAFLDQRVQDGVIRRTINKWLSAGIMEEGQLRYPDSGSPQGGIVSPILANVYLHEVLDVWFKETVRKKLRGEAFMVRFADDAVLVFSDRTDAQRVLEVLPQRFARFGLTLHPEKTRLVEFRRPRYPAGSPAASSETPGSFDFLGFTHYWRRSRQEKWYVARKTMKARLARACRNIEEWCAKHRHLKFRRQHQALSRKLHGHYAYYGVTSNYRALEQFSARVVRTWHYWLNRRSQRRALRWKTFGARLKRDPLPRPRILHVL